MNVRSRFVLVTMTILIALISCQNKESERNKDPLDENYKLIDRGSYSEAITNLTELAKKDSRPQVRVALGSAYAARGGIKVDQYWGFVVGFKAPLVKPENVQVNGTIESLQRIVKQADGNIAPKDMKALGGLIRTLAVWDLYKDRVEAIPVVQGEAIQDLNRAVNVLASVNTPGGRLYRGILNLILFKSYVTASQDFWEKFNEAIKEVLAGNLKALCKMDFEELLNWLNPVSYHLIETLNDLIVAYPESEKDFVEARNLVQAVYTATKEAIRELRDQRMCP